MNKEEFKLFFDKELKKYSVVGMYLDGQTIETPVEEFDCTIEHVHYSAVFKTNIKYQGSEPLFGETTATINIKLLKQGGDVLKSEDEFSREDLPSIVGNIISGKEKNIGGEVSFKIKKHNGLYELRMPVGGSENAYVNGKESFMQEVYALSNLEELAGTLPGDQLKHIMNQE